MKISKAGYTHIGGRKENEDSFRCERFGGGAYAVVADGLGGHGGGKTASELAVKTFSECRQCSSLPNQEQIRRWLEQANGAILDRQSGAVQMKTTVVFLAVWGGQAIWTHLGDSRLYHFYNGQLQDFTADHSVPQVQVLAGELTRDQIPTSPDRNRVLRALGSGELEPDLCDPVSLAPGRHAFLLCTDGFWEYLQEDELWLDLLKSSTPEEWLAYLRCRAEPRRQANADNNTAVAVFADV